MPLVVVDASAIAALVFGEDEAESVASLLEGNDLAAPSLLPYEVANVAALKVRRGTIPAKAGAAGVAVFLRLGVRLHPTDLAALVDVASACRLTAYDAAYLWLARELRAELVTLDRALASAFARR